MALVWFTSPGYIDVVDRIIRDMMLACSGIWMSIGIFVMRKMINFDF